MFDHEAEAQVTLKNTGKVSFKYSIVDPDMEVKADDVKGRLEVVDEPDSPQARELWPGRPTVIPATVSWSYFSSVSPRQVFRLFTYTVCVFACVQGYIEAGAERTLRVFYLPGVPDVFEKELQLKVAFLPPQVITLTGEGIFPRINLNLPTNLCKQWPAQTSQTTVWMYLKFLIPRIQNRSCLHVSAVSLCVTDCVWLVQKWKGTFVCFPLQLIRDTVRWCSRPDQLWRQSKSLDGHQWRPIPHSLSVATMNNTRLMCTRWLWFWLVIKMSVIWFLIT